LISEYDFVRFVRGPIVGEQQIPGPGTTSDHPSFSVTPTSIRFWENFKDSVRSMILDQTPRYPHPQFKENRVFRPEPDLHDLFSTDLGSLKFLEPRANTLRIFGLEHGKPDLIYLKKDGNPEDPNSILFPVEIKRPILLQSMNLVTSYREQEQSGAATGPARAVKQLFGYMRLNGYRYYVLSTYEQTWFLRVSQGRKDVLISPTIAIDSTEPTLPQCYLWFVREAQNDEEWTLDPPKDQETETILEDENPPDDGQEREECQMKIFTRSSSKTTAREVLPAFNNMQLMSYDEGAHTYKASWQGCNVVVKKCDIWNEQSVAEELKHEARIYQRLHTLQGRFIPNLKLAAIADGLEMVLVTDYVGTDVVV
ncbi:hypothetical protein BGZ83_003848, partial [Gryganskiella cystojenkinii]